MSNQKNEWDFQDAIAKEEFKVSYDALKCAKIPLSTGYNAVYGLEDVVLVLPHMCKNETTANRSVTELFLTFRDDRNVSIPTVQWLLGMIGAIDSNKMDKRVWTSHNTARLCSDSFLCLFHVLPVSSSLCPLQSFF